jgi:hypothetical protein
MLLECYGTLSVSVARMGATHDERHLIADASILIVFFLYRIRRSFILWRHCGVHRDGGLRH